MVKFKDMLTKAGLVTDDTPPRLATPKPMPVAPASVAAPYGNSASQGAQNVDPEMVSKLKTMVLGASPIISQFMQNVEIVRPQFPNDESACMKAALAFTRVEKTVLVDELNRTVSAALLHAKKSMENDRLSARKNAIGSLDTDLESANSSIKEKEAQIIALQQSITQTRATITELQGKIQNVEADLRRQDNTVNASFTQVEQYVTLLGQTFTNF